MCVWLWGEKGGGILRCAHTHTLDRIDRLTLQHKTNRQAEQRKASESNASSSSSGGGGGGNEEEDLARKVIYWYNFVVVYAYIYVYIIFLGRSPNPPMIVWTNRHIPPNESKNKKVAEAERIAAELMAEESKGGKKGGGGGNDTSTSGGGGKKKNKTPKA